MVYMNVEVWVKLDEAGKVLDVGLEKGGEDYLPVKAKFLKPGWLLSQKIGSESLNLVTGMMDPYAVLTNRVKYLLKELELPEKMKEKLADNGNLKLGISTYESFESVRNLDSMFGNDGIPAVVADTLMQGLNTAWVA